ncbi:MAG: hypothetical protein QOF33_3576 [Thermomicrobiales bacterium]|nr:hypothetical protein [Thermomicrobiales bacterium]
MKPLTTLLLLLLLAFLPARALADSTSATATLSVLVPPMPVAAAVLPGCQFVVTAGAKKAYCTVTLIMADSTLRNKGWQAKLAVTSFSCACGGKLSPKSLTVHSAQGPTLINGQPVSTKGGPKFVRDDHDDDEDDDDDDDEGEHDDGDGWSLSSSRPLVIAKPGYGNGAYSVTLVLELTIPKKTVPGTYIPTWFVSMTPGTYSDWD